MKRILKGFGFLAVTILVLLLLTFGYFYFKASNASKSNFELLSDEAPTLTSSGYKYRDLNKNGKLDAYEDARHPLDIRIEDLLAQMTLEEKAGTMFFNIIGMTSDGKTMETPTIASDPLMMMMPWMIPSGSEMIIRKHMNSFNVMGASKGNILAGFNNHIQKIAERTRLGIPISIASDPRHGVEYNPGVAVNTPIFSKWPGTLGLAATRDTQLIQDFGKIAAQEYKAVGFRIALHPMADLSTEPRWARTSGTFGEDAELASTMLRAYIRGFQGDTLSQNSVACMTKHFPGSSTNTDGHETHFAYGKEQSYTGDNFDYHVLPFSKGAFAVHTSSIMTSYGIPMGQTNEDVGMAFNKEIVTTLLRDTLGFDGVVCTDWNVVSDNRMGNIMKGGSSSWGVEDLTPIERVKKVIDAGCDQFGGESIPELIVELVQSNQISEERINTSVRRILKDKFILGLFEDPYLDEKNADKIVGQTAFLERGKEAQRQSIVLLKNDGLLPLKDGTKIYAEGLFRN